MTQGTFKHVFSNGVAWITQIWFYRIINGITYIKLAGNKFGQWMVGTIPHGAEIID